MTRDEVNTLWRAARAEFIDADRIRATTATEQIHKMNLLRNAISKLRRLANEMPYDVKLYAEYRPLTDEELDRVSLWPNDIGNTP